MPKKFLILTQLVFLFLAFIFPPNHTAFAVDGTQVFRQCDSHIAQGYFFDDFEKTDYLNGYLAIHLKLKTPYNDGRPWMFTFNMFAANCDSQGAWVAGTHLVNLPVNLQLFSIRFSSLTHFDIWDDETDIKLTCANCSGDIPAAGSNSTINYSTVNFFGTIDGNASFLNSTSYPIQGEDVSVREPIVIVPGILGSALQSGGHNIWFNVPSFLVDPNTSFLDQLDMDQNGKAKDPTVTADGVLTSVNYGLGTFHYTDLLVDALQKKGYVPQKDLFVFPYDWRVSVAETQAMLQAYIDQILKNSGAAKINIIAHSLGGLVVKEMLLNSAGAVGGIEDKIDKIIFAAVPDLGSAEAAQMLIFGADFHFPLVNFEEFKKLAQNMPSVYELLPDKAYFKTIAGFYDDVSNPKVRGILNYDQSQSLFNALGKNGALLQAAEALHGTAFDGFDFSGKKYSAYNIAGCGVFTTKTITKMYSGDPGLFKKIFYGPKYRISGDSGDGTVLVQSAAHLNVPAGNAFYAHGVAHGDMLSADGVRDFIMSLLDDKIVANSVVTKDYGNCSVEGRLVSLKSNLDFQIKDTVHGVTVDPQTLWRTKTGDDQYIFLPSKDQQNYIVSIEPQKATVQQKADISVETIHNQASTVRNYQNIDTSKKQTINMYLGTDESVQSTDPQGNTENIPPQVTLDTPNFDTIPIPHASIASTAGAIPQNGTLVLKSGQNSISFSADDMSNLLNYQYSFDGGNTWHYVDPNQNILVVPQGVEQIDFFAQAKTGQSEDVQSVILSWENNISSPQPIIIPVGQPNIEPVPQTGNSINSNSPAPQSSQSDSENVATAGGDAILNPDPIGSPQLNSDGGITGNILPHNNTESQTISLTPGQLRTLTIPGASVPGQSVPSQGITINLNLVVPPPSTMPVDKLLVAKPSKDHLKSIVAKIYDFLKRSLRLIFI